MDHMELAMWPSREFPLSLLFLLLVFPSPKTFPTAFSGQIPTTSRRPSPSVQPLLGYSFFPQNISLSSRASLSLSPQCELIALVRLAATMTFGATHIDRKASGGTESLSPQCELIALVRLAATMMFGATHTDRKASGGVEYRGGSLTTAGVPPTTAVNCICGEGGGATTKAISCHSHYRFKFPTNSS